MRTALFLILLAALPLSAQFQESIEVNVLELDVVVLDRDGRTVDGLKKEDFQVTVGKRASEVANFYAVNRGAIVDEQPAPTTAKRSAVASETLIPTTVVILIDDTRLGPAAKKHAIDALKTYVAANAGPAMSAMVVRWNGALDIRTRPTERAGQVIAELDKIGKEPALLTDSDRNTILKAIDDAMLGITGNQYAHSVQNAWIQLAGYADRETREVEKTLEALREVIKLASAFEGRKSLLYVSEGLPVRPAADLFDYWERMTRMQGNWGQSAHLMNNIAKDQIRSTDSERYDRSRQFEQLSRQAQSMNVHFYAVDAGGARGLDRGSLQQMQLVAEISSSEHRANLQDGIRMIANESGGRFISNENDLGRALSVVSEQFNTYYSLGVKAKRSTSLEKVAVKVKSRPELRVVTARHRKPLSRDEQIERAVRSRLYSLSAENRHNAELTAGVAFPANNRCVVPLRVTIPRSTFVPVGNGQRSVELHFAMLDELHQESDVQKTVVHVAPESDLSHLLSIGVKPGKYMFSLAIADPATGETSYLQRGFDASNCR